MNTKELAEQLITWLPELVAGKTLEYAPGRADSWYRIKTVSTLTEMIEDHREIRIKQTQIPDPPDGEKWHNPDSLTAEQIGIDYGWRLLLTSEIVKSRNVISNCYEWQSEETQWCDEFDDYSGSFECSTYRVKVDEYPVGSLKPPCVPDIPAQKLGDIAAYLEEHHGLSAFRSQLVANRLIFGHVPHMIAKDD